MIIFTGIFYIVVSVWAFMFFALVRTDGWGTPVFKIGSLMVGLTSAFLALHHYGFIVQLG